MFLKSNLIMACPALRAVITTFLVPECCCKFPFTHIRFVVD